MDRISICSSNLACHKTEQFLDPMVAEDEKWIVYQHVVKKIMCLLRGDTINHSCRVPEEGYAAFYVRQQENALISTKTRGCSTHKAIRPSRRRRVEVEGGERLKTEARSEDSDSRTSETEKRQLQTTHSTRKIKDYILKELQVKLL
ncbi:hypothetical protein TNCV_4006931 [Trichonephila clavipes]|nr:hypothetical protein TNCV_4006931 [Trichonephila clavipes]